MKNNFKSFRIRVDGCEPAGGENAFEVPIKYVQKGARARKFVNVHRRPERQDSRRSHGKVGDSAL